ncbi:MAG: hypothetical protein ABJA49_07900, partial [Betaproteobacteria bacterium]
RTTMDKSWLRPRYPGFLTLADRGGNAINAFVRGDLDESATLAELDAAYQDSLLLATTATQGSQK